MLFRSLVAFCLLAVSAISAPSQPSAIKQNIVGAWSLVAVTAEFADGKSGEPFGPAPKGVIIFTQDGNFSLFQSRAELPKIAANDRNKATPEEAAALVGGSIAYYGTYDVNESDRSISVTLTGSTYPNLLGPPQKRLITALDSSELKFDNPRTPSGMTLHTTWRRAAKP